MPFWKSENITPFEILPGPEGHYMIEKYRISYLTTGRDLLSLKGQKRIEGRSALIFANPDFDFEQEPTLRHIEGRSRDFMIHW